MKNTMTKGPGHERPGHVRLGRVELDPAKDRHARAALEAYADSAATDMPWLAEWLHVAMPATHPGFTYCTATVERVFAEAHAWAASQPGYAAGAWEQVRGQLQQMLRQHSEPAGREK